MKKLVIFDLDGTLIDSVHDIVDCINVMLEKFNHNKRTTDDIKQMIGNGAKNLVKRAVGEALTEEQLKERLDFYNEIYTASGSPKTCLFSGVDEMLIELKKRGYMLAILTNKPQMTTDGINKTYLNDFNFDIVIGQRVEFKIKPDPSAVYYILNELGVQPENTYFIGDGETDAETAINAGINGVSVLWGYRSREQLQKAGAQIFACTPKELLNIIS